MGGLAIDFLNTNLLTLSSSYLYQFYVDAPTSCYTRTKSPPSYEFRFSSAMSFTDWAQTYTNSLGMTASVAAPLEVGLLSATVSENFHRTVSSFDNRSRKIVTLSSENTVQGYEMQASCLYNLSLVHPMVFRLLNSSELPKGDYTS